MACAESGVIPPVTDGVAAGGRRLAHSTCWQSAFPATGLSV
ncbi:hypothetical protein ECP030230812_5408 [Escherichia coli P0302308.12]|nr:hypothetical protein ECP03023083_5113 [Escherichia coli P0302308.3]ENH10567.1 hypothetical protein ECP030230812_5408 [Escherichia coli P0302308.12]